MIIIRRLITGFALLAPWFITSCNSDTATGAYSEILSSPPYSAISDSIRRQPGNDELYFRRAVLLNKNNLPEPALADFRKAWSISRQERYAFGITNIWYEQQPDSAAVFLRQALEDLPESYLLRLTLARTYDKLNRTDEALATLDGLLKTYPQLTDAWVLKSQLHDRKDEKAASLAAIEKAHALVPQNLAITVELAYKYAEMKDARTLSLCDSVIRADAEQVFASAYYIKGIYYSNIRDDDKALQLFDETIRRDHNQLNAYIEKGKILVNRKNYTAALGVFQLANRVKPSFPDAWYWMAVCQEAMGKKEEAKLNYEKAYSLDKQFTEAADAVKRLEK